MTGEIPGMKRVTAMFLGDDLDGAMGMVVEKLPGDRWLVGLIPDPAPPADEPDARTLLVEWCGDEGPTYLVRGGDFLTVDPDDETWRGVCHWPAEPRPAPHLDAFARALDGWVRLRTAGRTERTLQ